MDPPEHDRLLEALEETAASLRVTPQPPQCPDKATRSSPMGWIDREGNRPTLVLKVLKLFLALASLAKRRLRSSIKLVSDDEELRGRNNATRLEAATYVQNPLPNAPCRFRLE